jgi:hypothetical protein
MKEKLSRFANAYLLPDNALLPLFFPSETVPLCQYRTFLLPHNANLTFIFSSCAFIFPFYFPFSIITLAPFSFAFLFDFLFFYLSPGGIL